MTKEEIETELGKIDPAHGAVVRTFQRKVSRYATVAWFTLLVERTKGSNPGDVVTVKNLDTGQDVLIKLPEDADVQHQNMVLDVVDIDGNRVEEDINVVEIAIDRVRSSFEDRSGKGSPEMRAARTKVEMETLIRHCLGCAAVERAVAKTTSRQAEVDSVEKDRLLALAVTCEVIDQAKADALRGR